MTKPNFEKNLKKFKNNLKMLMEEKNIKQTPLGNSTGIDATTIGKYLDETNNNYPGSEQLLKLANYFGVSVSYLLGETDAREVDAITIKMKLGIDDDAFHNLEGIKKINEKYENKYSDIVGKIITDVPNYKNVIRRIDMLLKYYTDDTYKKDLNDQLKLCYPQLNELGKRSKLTVDEYIDMDIIQKQLELYHQYVDIRLLETDYTTYNKNDLERKQIRLEKELREVKRKLKNYEN